MGASVTRFFTTGIKLLPVIVVFLVFFLCNISFSVTYVVPVILRKSFISSSIAFVIVYAFIILLFIWSFLATIFTNPGEPGREDEEIGTTLKDGYQKIAGGNTADAIGSTQDDERGESWIDFLNSQGNMLGNQKSCETSTMIARKRNGATRFCRKCDKFKPDRTHHCSTCGKCRLKMDHHCPWVANCIGFRNYKFFVLFLFYGLVLCSFVGGNLANKLVSEFEWESLLLLNYQWPFVIIASLSFGLGCLVLLVYHIYLILWNKTTIEAIEKKCNFSNLPTSSKDGKHFNPYDIGMLSNFKEVFGDNLFAWPFPVFSSKGDGKIFPKGF